MPKQTRRPKSGKRSKRRHSQNQNQNYNQNQSYNIYGGEGAATYVAAVAGGTDSQSAVGNGSNTIALTPMSGMTGGSGLNILTPSNIGSNSGNLMSGGNSLSDLAKSLTGGKKKPSKRGGNLLQQLAVPAVLLYANNTFGRRGKSSGRKTRRFRGSRRFRK